MYSKLRRVEAKEKLTFLDKTARDHDRHVKTMTRDDDMEGLKQAFERKKHRQTLMPLFKPLKDYLGVKHMRKDPGNFDAHQQAKDIIAIKDIEP